MATTSIVRLSDSDIDRLAVALAERTEAQLTDIAARLADIEAQLLEKKPSRKKAAAK